MSVRSRAGGPGTVLAVKAFGGNEPPGMAQAASDVSQMDMQYPFSPGQPVGPYDGYSRHTRQFDFTTGYNIATRPRTHERVSFDTLRGLIDSYDFAQICIWHRIDSLRSLDWKLVAADWYSGDVSDATTTGMAALKKPDRINSFEGWFAKWMFDVLAYDAGVLSRLRNRAGRCIGLQPVDGTTIAPLLDYWGDPPRNPDPAGAQPEAYVQYVNGLPWNWLTRSDLIYEPFRPRSNSPYGHAPLEIILINANTDVRFQLYFLQRFTSGNIPEAFASAPETWQPEQIERFQAEWDAMLYGDQARKNQIRWIPGGAKIAWSNEKDFTDAFSLFLMRKTGAAYHVVPSDMGFTETVNLASSESQADVGHRVGDLPLGHYAERILTSFLQDDLGLPLQFQFDWGEEQDDRLNQAEADQIYIQNAVVGASEIRQMRFGLAEPEGQVVPRIFFTAREGPIPLNALYGVAGKLDAATGAPDPGTPLPHEVFTTVQGVIPDPPLTATPLAAEEFGPKAIPPAPPMQPQATPKATDAAHQVAKEGEGVPAAGVTSETGIFGYDLDKGDDEDGPQDETVRVAAVKSELAAFRRFSRSRQRAGEWRDFRFSAVGSTQAHNLNDDGRLAVRKAAGEIAVTGLAVLAADTGRVLMLQRALSDDDPAGGTWEFPGGHLDGSESPLQAAWREWAEETGCVPPPGAQTGTWTSTDGIYQGIVWTTESESGVPVRCDTEISNPDDPDGDQAEAIAWWNPPDLHGNSAVRPELAASLDAVLPLLGCGPGDDAEDVAKAGGADPKGWPGWTLDGAVVAYWAPLIAAAASAALPRQRLAELTASWLASGPPQGGSKRDRDQDAAGWLADQGVTFGLDSIAAEMLTDAFASGAVAAAALVNGGAPDKAGWQPGDTDAAGDLVAGLGLTSSLGTVAGAAGGAAASMQAGYLGGLGKALTDGQDAGLSTSTVASAMGDVLDDPARAAAMAADQVTAASGQAAQAYYGAAEVGQVVWLTESANPCPVCEANAAAGPVQTGMPFPSGDTNAPIHPNCACAVVPA